MNLSELFIRRPVMTVLLNLAFLAAGVLGYRSIPVSALPSYDTPVINVSASLPGASPETMASSVALALEKQFQQIPGLVQMSSTSSTGSTSLTLEFAEGKSMDGAALDVQAALLRAQRTLPTDMTQPPSYRKVNPADAPVLIAAMTSESMSPTEMQDYAEHLIVPTLSMIDGVAQVNVFGSKRFAVRVAVNPAALAARNLALDDVSRALAAANANTPVGSLDGDRQTLTIVGNQQLSKAADFASLVIASRSGAAVRLRDVADVRDSVETVKTYGSFEGVPSIVLAIQRQPDANTVRVVDGVRQALDGLRGQLPAALEITPFIDRSLSVREALHDVSLTLLGTVALVILVIFLFLRRWVATLVPTLSLPVSLMGAVALLWGLNYSLDNVSLLGLTLAVGLVVDDAIVMLENIMRHIEAGEPPFAAALKGSREVGFTIISISISLIAVFIPIFFMPGVIGLLFHEFAVVVGLAIAVSAFVSLTLVPMLAARLLSAEDGQHAHEGRVLHAFESVFQFTLRGYTRALDWALAHRIVVLLLAMATFVATAWLFMAIPKGFFPQEDIGQIMVSTEAAQDVSFPELVRLQTQASEIIRADPAVDRVSSFTGAGGTQNSGRMFIALKDRAHRPGMEQVVNRLRGKLRAVPGLRVFMRPVQNLQLGGRSSRAQYQYVLQSVQTDTLYSSADKLAQRMRGDNRFLDVNTDTQMRGLQLTLDIDRDKASALGVSMDTLRSTLYSAFGERQVATIYLPTDSYRVVMEVDPAQKKDEAALTGLFVRSASGAMVPLSALTTARRTIGPSAINHVGQTQAVTISFNLAPGVALGDATQALEKLADEVQLPSSIIRSFGGEAAVFQKSQGNQVMLILGALLVIYVLLGVLYESYIHPVTILAGLPSAAVGALATLMLFGQRAAQTGTARPPLSAWRRSSGRVSSAASRSTPSWRISASVSR